MEFDNFALCKADKLCRKPGLLQWLISKPGKFCLPGFQQAAFVGVYAVNDGAEVFGFIFKF